MAITISGSGITSANIADGTITTDDILASDVSSLKSGRKNLIINGGFDVSQRKDVDSAAITTAVNRYDIDRFLSSIVTVTATNQRLLDQAVNGKIVNTFKQVATSSGTGRLGQVQRFELLPKGETVTLSVWVRSNTANARLFHYDNTTLIGSSAHTGGGGWEKLMITTPLDADKSTTEALLRVSTSTNGNVAITSGDYIESAMWQLELGSVATDFEHRSYGEELALCQRYYENANTHTGFDTYYLTVFRSDDWGARVGHFEFNTTKRTNPTITTSINAGTLSVTTNVNGFRATGSGAVTNPTTINDWEADAEL